MGRIEWKQESALNGGGCFLFGLGLLAFAAIVLYAVSFLPDRM